MEPTATEGRGQPGGRGQVSVKDYCVGVPHNKTIYFLLTKFPFELLKLRALLVIFFFCLVKTYGC